MSWLAKNVGSLASRIAAEANGDNQYGNNEILQQLNQQLLETREELSERHQEWERAKQNYEARLKSLTEGNATAQKVEQLEHKLNRAVELLKTLNNEKQNLNARIKTLEAEKKEAEAAAAAAEAAAAEVAAVQAEIYNDGLSNVDHGHENAGNERIQDLEAELKAEKEQHSLFVQALKDQLSILTETNEGLKAQLAGHQEEIDAQAELSIQLELTKEELEQARNDIATLKENNAKLASQAEAAPQSPSQHPSSPALAKELMDAKSIIAELEARLSKESEGTAEISILKASQKDLQDTLATLHEELKQSKEIHSEAQNELNNSKEVNATLEESKVSMSETIAQLNSQLETLRISDVEAKKLLEQYEEEKRTLSASCDSLRQELEETKSKYEEHVVLAASPKDTNQEKHKEEFENEKCTLLAIQDGLNKELEALKKKYDEDCLAAEGALKERELTIHDLQKTVATNKEVLKSVEEDLQRTVNEHNQLQSQHNTLLDRIANMKSTLGTKLQADMENINIQRQQIDQLTEQNNSYIQTIKQLEEELMASHEHYEKTSRELEHLRRHMDDIKEDAFSEVVEKENLLQELQSRLQREEREREDWETMASEQRASKDQAVMNMRAMERERDAARAEKEALRQELNREIESLNNLQTVLEEFQSTKESEIQFALEGLQRELKVANFSLEENRNRAQVAEEQLHHLTLDVEKARQLEREVKEKNQLIGKLRHDAVIQQGHLTEAMRRLKEENNQNTVDIPLISNLFISFLNIPRGDQKRFEILQLISGVLKFTDEQREQAGLIRKAGGLGAMTPTTSGSRSPSMEQMRQHQEPKEGFFDMWASFLIRESNANVGGNNPRSPS